MKVSQSSNARVSLVVLAITQKLCNVENELWSLFLSPSVYVKREIEITLKIETLDGLGFPQSKETSIDCESSITCQFVSVCDFCAST